MVNIRFFYFIFNARRQNYSEFGIHSPKARKSTKKLYAVYGMKR